MDEHWDRFKVGHVTIKVREVHIGGGDVELRMKREGARERVLIRILETCAHKRLEFVVQHNSYSCSSFLDRFSFPPVPWNILSIDKSSVEHYRE
jgi:hypothetical protein